MAFNFSRFSYSDVPIPRLVLILSLMNLLIFASPWVNLCDFQSLQLANTPRAIRLSCLKPNWKHPWRTWDELHTTLTDEIRHELFVMLILARETLVITHQSSSNARNSKLTSIIENHEPTESLRDLKFKERVQPYIGRTEWMHLSSLRV